MLDTVGVLERSFTPVEEGYLYYPSRWSHGYLVAPDEYRTLIDEWRRIAGWKGLFKLVGIMYIVLMIGMIALEYLGLADVYETIVTVGSATALAGYILWKGTAASRLVRGREPAAPPRSSTEADTDMAKALGRPMAAWMTFVSISLLFWAILFAVFAPLWGIPAAILVSVVVFFSMRIAIRAFRSKSN